MGWRKSSAGFLDEPDTSDGEAGRTGGGTEGGADAMTRRHGWTSDSGQAGRNPDDQHPPAPYPWEPAPGQGNDAGMAPMAQAPYQPQPPHTPAWGPTAPAGAPNMPNMPGADRPDFSYPLRAADVATGVPSVNGNSGAG